MSRLDIDTSISLFEQGLDRSARFHIPGGAWELNILQFKCYFLPQPHSRCSAVLCEALVAPAGVFNPYTAQLCI